MSKDRYEFRGLMIPPHLLQGLQRYVTEHKLPGGFLTAVLENNLRDAVGRADSHNMLLLPAYVAYLYNEVPAACWGSPENVRAWCAAAAAEEQPL